MTSGRLSIIIPIYNSGTYLSRCIQSILSQSFKGEMEVLLIDDGSTDGSGNICDEIAGSDDRIKVYHTKNKGASLARKYGLDLAKGDYVTFIDSDDYVMPDYLSSLFDLEACYGIGISACDVVSVLPGEKPHTEIKEERTLLLEGEELFQRFFKYEFWGLYGKLYRKSVFNGVGFPQATICEDYYVMAQLLHDVGKMAFKSVPLYCYERHEASLSHQVISDRAFEEFSNTKDVYLFTSKEMPEYKSNALANAVESAVKLLLASKKQSETFVKQRKCLSSFLACHRKEILSCKQLNRKTGLIALALSCGKKKNN